MIVDATIDWERIDDESAVVFRVMGDSMLPTLEESDAILEDYGRSTLIDDHIFVLQDRHRMLVKRAKYCRRWCFLSDNPTHKAFPLEEHMIIFGEVKCYGRSPPACPRRERIGRGGAAVMPVCDKHSSKECTT